MKFHQVSSALIPSKTLSWGSKNLYITLSRAFGHQIRQIWMSLQKCLTSFRACWIFYMQSASLLTRCVDWGSWARSTEWRQVP